MAIPTEDRNFQKLSKEEQHRLGLPDGWRIFSPFPFGGINQKDSQYGMPDQKFFWSENIVKSGNGKLRSLPDVGSAIYTAPAGRNILTPNGMFFYNIGLTDYMAVFLDDGTAVQINLATSGSTTISSTPNTFFIPGGNFPDAGTWGSQYLLIANTNTVNDYWVWDGNILFSAGSLSPSVILASGGSGYTSVPTVAFFGGSGSGATGVATISNGFVTGVMITNPGSGYSPGDIVQVQFSGGGGGAGAILTAVLGPGSLSNINLTSGGSGYTSRPAVGFTGGGGGSGAAATAILAPTHVATVSVGAGGTGYTIANVIFSGGGGGTGAAATAVISGTAVTAINMTSFGSGYTDVPTVTITGDGTLATATAHLAATSVGGFVVTAPGSGYTTTPGVTLSGGGGTLASGQAILQTNSVASVNIINGGTGFATVPLLSFSGGGGSGAVATAAISGGAITGVTVTNGGTGYTSAPAVIVEGGANTAASGTVTLMPFGVSGASIETFQQRVWLPHPFQPPAAAPTGGDINISAPGLFEDFNESDGAEIFTNTDRFLTKEFTNIIQSNGYLYPIGDSSVNVISNVQTSGNPPITTFNYQNVDPTVGTPFHNTVQPFSRAIVMLNPLGVYSLYGGSVDRVSTEIDDIFANAIFPPKLGALTPSAAVAYIHDTLYYIALLTITDPFTKLPRNVMLLWDKKEWFIASQSMALTYIAPQTVNSRQIAYGTDGKTIKQLFAQPSITLQKVLVTKLYGAQLFYFVKMGFNVMLQGQDKSGTSAIMSLVLNTENAALPLPYTADLTTPQVFTGPVEDAYGAYLGLTIASTSPDFIINDMGIGYGDAVGPMGSGNQNAPVGPTP